MIKRLHNALLSILLIVSLGAVLLLGQADFNPWSTGCADGEGPVWNAAAGKWKCQAAGGSGSLPAGAVVLIVSGSCPSGFAEETTLDGKTLFGTLAVHADIGGTGGADNITPGGTVAWPAGVPAFAGTASTVVVNHVHVQTAHTAATGPNVGYGVDASTNTAVTSGYSTANPTGGAASYTPAGTISWPAGVPAFSGTQFDNRSAFVKVIFCKKT